MIPTNGELFGNPCETEEPLLLPKEYPWQALERMEKLFAQFERGELTWPENMPPYTKVNRGAHPHVLEIIGSFNTGPVRGGWELGTDEHVVLRGPVYVGRNVKFRKGAVITGPCFIGDGVTIGQGCRIKHSIIRSGAEIQFGTRVAHSLIGANVFVGAGAILNDRPLDNTEVCLAALRSIGASRLGLMAGDDCVIGGGSVFVSGAVLMPGSFVQATGLAMRASVYSDDLFVRV